MWIFVFHPAASKNVSVPWDDGLNGFRLSPAYDLLSTLPYGDRRMALKVDGRDDNFSLKGLTAFAARFGIEPVATPAAIDALCDIAPAWLRRLDEIGLEPRRTRDLMRTSEKRRNQLGARG